MAEGYKNPTNDPRGLFTRFLPTSYRDTDTSNDVHKAVLTAIQNVFEVDERDIKESKKQLFLDTATGDFLNTWGNFIGVYRKEGETDNHYRAYLKDWITAKKGTVQGIIDGIHRDLGEDVDVIIYEPWRNIFYLDKSLLDGIDHLQGSYYQYAVIDIKIDKWIPEEDIMRIIDRYKTVGVMVYVTYSPTTETSGNLYDLTLKPSMFLEMHKDDLFPHYQHKAFTIGAISNEDVGEEIFRTDKSNINSKDVLAGDPNYERFTYNFAGLLDEISNIDTNTSFEDITSRIFEFSPEIYPALNIIDGRTFTIKGSSGTFDQNKLATMLLKELSLSDKNGKLVISTKKVINDNTPYRKLLDIILNNIYFDRTDKGIVAKLKPEADEQLGMLSELAHNTVNEIKANDNGDSVTLMFNPSKNPVTFISDETPQRDDDNNVKAGRTYKVSELATHIIKMLTLNVNDNMVVEYSYREDAFPEDEYRPFLHTALAKVDFKLTPNNGIMAYVSNELDTNAPTTKMINDALKAISFTVSDTGNVTGWVIPPDDDERFINFNSVFVFNWDEYYRRNPEVGSVQFDTQYIKVDTMGSPYGFTSTGSIDIYDRSGIKLRVGGEWVKIGDKDVSLPGNQSLTDPDVSSQSYIYKLNAVSPVGGIGINGSYAGTVKRRISVSRDGVDYVPVGYINSNGSGIIPVTSYTESSNKAEWIYSRIQLPQLISVLNIEGLGGAPLSMYNFNSKSWSKLGDLQPETGLKKYGYDLDNNFSPYVSNSGLTIVKIDGINGDLVMDYLALEFDETIPVNVN